MALSLFAEIVATWAISFLPATFLACFFSSAMISAEYLSIPRFTSIGFAPAVILRKPSLNIAWASTVAVVVPSPAWSFVLLATSRTKPAPIFSRVSFSSISFATLTPSFVILGAPKLFWISTLRPRGPIVTFTASFSFLTPEYNLFLASSEKKISFAIFYSFCKFELF